MLITTAIASHASSRCGRTGVRCRGGAAPPNAQRFCHKPARRYTDTMRASYFSRRLVSPLRGRRWGRGGREAGGGGRGAWGRGGDWHTPGITRAADDTVHTTAAAATPAEAARAVIAFEASGTVVVAAAANATAQLVAL